MFVTAGRNVHHGLCSPYDCDPSATTASVWLTCAPLRMNGRGKIVEELVDGVAGNARGAAGGPDAHAFDETSDDLGALIYAQPVHAEYYT